MEQSMSSADLEKLRRQVDDRDYLRDAIQRIALVMSNELLDISRGGIGNERQRKGR